MTLTIPNPQPPTWVWPEWVNPSPAANDCKHVFVMVDNYRNPTAVMASCRQCGFIKTFSRDAWMLGQFL